MEKKRGYLLNGELIRIVGAAFVLLMVCLLWFSQDVRAENIPVGTVRTSTLRDLGYSGKVLDMTQDGTIIVDADFSAGKLRTGSYNLTIEGDGNATLTLGELSTNENDTGKPITIKSGKVHVNCTTTTASFDTAVYCAKRFTISGGELTITNTKRSHGLLSESLYISGGKLKIAMNQGTSSTITGISFLGTGGEVFSMSGGELNIEVSGVSTNTAATMTGLYLNSGCKGVITGGKTYISAAYNSGTGSEIRGIHGDLGSSLLISGGSVYTQGHSAGICCVPLEISGDALVTANAKRAGSAGIHVDKLKLSGRPIVRAEGGKSAISAESIEPVPKTLIITEPKNGIISLTGSGSSARYEVVTSGGVPSPAAVIDYVDNPGTVTVIAAPSELIKGTVATVTCKASMSGYAHDVGFSWSLTGNRSGSTKIDAGGILHIAADETSDRLIVTAAANANKSIRGSAEITLIEKPGKAKAETDTETETSQSKKREEKITIWKAPASVKAKAKKNKITVTWKKIKKSKKTKALRNLIKGVEVQYSTDPSFPEETTFTNTTGGKKTKLVLKRLQRKTVYFVRVRYTDGAGGYSYWSKVKRARTK